MAFYDYILQSQSSSRYYIGQTQDLSDRVAYHNSNYSKSLKNRGPWQLLYTEQYGTRAEAVRREPQIKSWKDRKMTPAIGECVPVKPGRSWIRTPSPLSLMLLIAKNLWRTHGGYKGRLQSKSSVRASRNRSRPLDENPNIL